MANTSSAKKAERVALRRRVHNLRRTRALKDAVKQMGKLVNGKKAEEAKKQLEALYQAVDKAAKTNAINKNTAARMKSGAARRLRSIVS